MTTPTAAPVPSTSPQDLLFNAEKLDQVVNGTDLSFVDRLGVSRRTVAGTLAALNADAADAVAVAAAIRVLQGAAAPDIAEAVANLTTEELNGLAGATGASMIGSGARSVQNRLDDQVSLRDKGAVLDGTTDDSAALVAADAAAAGRPILVTGVAHIGTAVTITTPLVDVTRQIFSATSLVTIDNGLPVRPEWWGDGFGTVVKAISALPAAGGTVLLRNRRYNRTARFTTRTT